LVHVNNSFALLVIPKFNAVHPIRPSDGNVRSFQIYPVRPE
jgi:hypothetical protein